MLNYKGFYSKLVITIADYGNIILNVEMILSLSSNDFSNLNSLYIG